MLKRPASGAGGQVAGLRSGGLRNAGGLRSTAKGAGDETDAVLAKAWKDGELVLIQPDVTRALHSGQVLSQRQGCLNVEWSEYLARMHALHGSHAADFMAKTFLPGLLTLVDEREYLFLDHCSASGCMLRGSVLALAQAGVDLRRRLRRWLMQALDQHDACIEDAGMPALSMCLDMTGEWTFSELKHPQLGLQRIAFSLAVPQVSAGVRRDRDAKPRFFGSGKGALPLGQVHVKTAKTEAGERMHVMYNGGFALTESALSELTTVLGNKAVIRSVRPRQADIVGVLDGYQMPVGGLELLVIQRFGHEDEVPWLLMKAGKTDLAGVDTDIFELMDADAPATVSIVEHGLMRWA